MKTILKKIALTLIIMFLLPFLKGLGGTSFAQIKKGADINGVNSNDKSGRVSMPDANTVAIGSPEYGFNGHVRVFSWNGSIWNQKGLSINGEASNDLFGFSVSMPDANTVAIGALNNDGNGTDAGHVRVYTWNGSAWVQKGTDIDGEAAGDRAGRVSMPDANTIAIGAGENDGSGTDAGHVRVYTWNGGAWVQKGADIDGEAAGDFSGISVSMSDANTVAIGAFRNDDNGTISGHVRIYTWNGNSWVQKGVDIDGEAAGDNSGASVSMPDTNTVAIGASGNDVFGFNTGHARVYSWNGNVWIQKGLDIDGEAAGDESGCSVSMPDANTIAIGAYKNDSHASDVGHVRIYKWNGSVWVQKGIDIDGQSSSDFSGISVSMPDTNTVAIGAIQNDANGTNAGHVRVYDLCAKVGIDAQTACNSFTWIDNVTYTSSTYTPIFTLTGGASNGCDSIVKLNLIINNTVTGTDIQIACNSFTWIDNITYTSSTNTPAFTIPNGAVNGCDSIVTLNLTINNTVTGTDVQAACNSFTWIDNVTYSSSTNTPIFTISNGAVNGCDSIVTLNLTINNTVTGTDVQAACNSFTWIDNVTYTSSTNTPTFTIPNGAVNGCDSIVTLNLTISTNVATGTDVQVACNSFTWIDNIIYTSSTNTPTFTIPNGAVNGCDSIVTLNLTISTNAAMSTDIQVACNSFTWIDNITYTSSTNTPTFTITNGAVNGCDSIVTLNLTINNTVTFTDIDGEASGDWSGTSVSMPDANTIAIGAVLNDGNGINAGHVRIYTLNGSAWIQKGADIDGEAAGDSSGVSVSMPDANTVAIGAITNDNANGINAGHVRVYTWNGNNWVQKGTDIDGEVDFDLSGFAVSMPNANTVAVGSLLTSGNISTVFLSGRVRVYTWNGSAWVQKGANIDGEAAFDQSGTSISMPDDNTVAIGAFLNDGAGTEAGHVRIYTWNGNNWLQKGLDIDGEAAFDQSGTSISMPDANTVAIGAMGNDNINGIDAGHVRVYTWNGSNWLQKGTDIDGEAAGDSLGASVSMPDANTIAIGATGNDNINGIDAGYVRIYTWNGSNWVQKVVDIYGVASGDKLGVSVSMPNANTVATGAHLNDGAGIDAGHVRVAQLFSATGIDTQTACDSLTWIDGITYTLSTNTPTFNIVGGAVNGCDSVVTLNLTINNLNASYTNTDNGGGNFTFTNTSTGSFTQTHWAFGDGTTSTLANPTHTFSANGTYVVVLTINDSTTNNTCIDYYLDTLVVTGVVNPAPCAAGFVMYPDGNGNLVLVNSSTGNNLTYFWDFGDGDTSTMQFPSHTYATTGPFYLCLTVNDGASCVDTYCDSIGINGVVFNKQTGFTINVIAPPVVVGVDEQGALITDVTIYPNPTTNEFVVELSNFSPSTQINIISVEGKMVYTNSSINTNKINVDAANWSRGIYIVKITDKQSSKVVKLVKQ